MALLTFSPLLHGASSIFDDEGWEDPSIEPAPAPKIEREPAPAVKPRPAPRRDPEPSDVTEPDPDPVPDIPDDPEPEPADPEEIVKTVTAKIKAAGRLPAKLDDPQIIHLFHQKAVAHARLGEIQPARAAMTKVLAAKLTNRSVVLNVARLDIVTKNDAMRAATLLEKHMKAHPDDSDALDLWGVAMATIVRNKRRLPEAKVEAFLAAQTLLEQTRPGYRRWGVQWVDESGWAEIQRERELVMKDVRLHEERVREERRRYESVRRANIGRRIRIGNLSRPDPAALARIEEAADRLRDAQRELNKHRRRLPRPSWVLPLRMNEPDPKMEPKETGV